VYARLHCCPGNGYSIVAETVGTINYNDKIVIAMISVKWRYLMFY
jgi:hypothetical protein